MEEKIYPNTFGDNYNISYDFSTIYLKAPSAYVYQIGSLTLFSTPP